MSKLLIVIVIVLAVAAFAGVGSYNSLNAKDEQIRGEWSEVLNQYQRRADLVPNLVETVKGIAEQEKEVMIGVTEARAKVNRLNLPDEALDDPARLQQFQAAQGELGSALSRLLVTVERYPDLASAESFRDLQAQLEGTENRISVARNRYIDAVRDYNTTVRQFPGNLVAGFFGFNRRPNFTVEDEDGISKPPAVNLSG